MNSNLSQNGQVIVAANGTTTGSFRGLLAVGNTTVGNMTWASDYEADGKWSDLTVIPAGTLLEGRFTSITLVTPQAILYKL